MGDEWRKALLIFEMSSRRTRERRALLHYFGKEPPVKPIRPPARNLRAIGWRRACATGNATTR
jgi:hypothetical protein